MKDFANTDFRDHSPAGVIARFVAHVKARLTPRERTDPRLRFHVQVGADGYEYLAPVANGAALPMARRKVK